MSLLFKRDWHPMTRKRWLNFKASRRGYRSFQIFIVLFVITLFAELIANDKPLLIRYDRSFYTPAFGMMKNIKNVKSHIWRRNTRVCSTTRTTPLPLNN